MNFLKRLLITAWGVYALIVFFTLALLLTLAVALIPSQKTCRWMVHRTARLILKLAGIPLEVRHLDRLPEGPCVIVANHASYLDGPLIAAAQAGENTFGKLMEAVKSCSLGTITHSLYLVGGQYRRNM